MAESITILCTGDGSRATKLFRLRGSTNQIERLDYAAGRLFTFAQFEIVSVHHLSQLLFELEEKTQLFVIRGDPKSNVAELVTRRVHGDGAGFMGAPKCWLMTDFDGIPLPGKMTLSADNIGAAIDHCVRLLPEEFRSASFHWRLSSSAGFKDPGLISCHMWWWLDRPVEDAELRRWARWWNSEMGLKVVDPAIFNPVQPHYTARPIFTNVADPFPTRSGFVKGSQDVVTLRLPPPPPKAATAQAKPLPRGLEGIVARHALNLGLAAAHAAVDGRHPTLLRMAVQCRRMGLPLEQALTVSYRAADQLPPRGDNPVPREEADAVCRWVYGHVEAGGIVLTRRKILRARWRAGGVKA